MIETDAQQHIVVIGAGQAGAALVAKLRALGSQDRITLIGNEDAPPYQRPPLSKKYLLGEISREQLYLRPPEFYENNNITLRTGEQVTAIDAENRTVRLSNSQISYDQLVLTTGSDPRQLPAAIGGDLEGVYVVRNLADVDAMAPEFVTGRKLLIIGGGYIGLEAAAVAALRGLDVTLVEMAERILQRVAAEQTADYFRALHVENGVRVLEGVGLTRLIGEQKVSSALLSDGSTLDVDFVVVGVGIIPATTLAQTAGVTIDNGIRVDACGRTSDPNIWAAGDCASFPLGDSYTRIESVSNAIDQAECIARNLAGTPTQYEAKPWFWSDQFAVKLQIAGLSTGYDAVVTRPGKREGAVSHWYYRNGALIAVDAMNDPSAYMVGKRLIESGKSVDMDTIQNPDSDLKSLLKA